MTNPPSCAVDVSPAVPTATSNSSATAGSRNGVAANTAVLVAIDTSSAAGTDGRAAAISRSGAWSGTGDSVAELAPEDEPGTVEPWDYSSGYLQRAKHLMPKVGPERPWTLKHEYLEDVKDFRQRPVRDGVLRFYSVDDSATEATPAEDHQSIAAE